MQRDKSDIKKIFQYQGLHLFGWLIMGALFFFASHTLSENQKIVFGLSARGWLFFSWIFAGLFHLSIVFFWRLELYGAYITRWMGQSGFIIHRLFYVVFGSLALFSVIPVSMASAHSLEIPKILSLALIVISTPLILWGLYCALFYFGLNRASGADHFDIKYRKMQLEKRGIYKYIPNVMYTVVLLLLYHPGLFFGSTLGLIAAVLHHSFVWLHYFTTEKPDLKEIYQK